MQYALMKRHGLAVVLCALFAFLLTPGATAEVEQLAKLTAGDAVGGERLGASVAVHDNVLISGAYLDADAGSSGSAYIFRRNGTDFSEEQKLTPNDPTLVDNFGWTVSVHGDVALVGANADSHSGDWSGSAFVYRFDGATWVEEQKLIASDTVPYHNYGESVAVSGDVALIGATGDNESGDDSGAAYVYRFNGTVWVEEQKLTPSDWPIAAQFGYYVSVDGDVALVAANRDSHVEDGAGSVYVYRFDGATWVEEQKLTASDPGLYDIFGSSVSVSGDLTLIGASYDDLGSRADAGSAYVFRFDGAAWNEEQKIWASDYATDDGFGYRVSISGDVALIGAAGNDDDGPTSGSAYVFRYFGGAWVEDQKLNAADAAALDGFGVSVSIAGETMIIGASGVDEAGVDSGAIYEFGPGCFAGTVNAGAGPADNVLFINGSLGGSERKIWMSGSDLIGVTVVKPVGGGNGRFVLHADEGNEFSRTVLPKNVGTTCFPFLLTAGADPVIVANNLGKRHLVGESNFYGTPAEDPDPAPTFFGYFGPFSPGTVLTFQGIILDPGSASHKGASVTNAVVVEVW